MKVEEVFNKINSINRQIENIRCIIAGEYDWCVRNNSKGRAYELSDIAKESVEEGKRDYRIVVATRLMDLHNELLEEKYTILDMEVGECE